MMAYCLVSPVDGMLSVFPRRVYRFYSINGMHDNACAESALRQKSVADIKTCGRGGCTQTHEREVKDYEVDVNRAARGHFG